MWSGSIASIPAGYVLCDGNNGTPDLRNKFIASAQADLYGDPVTDLGKGPEQTGGSVQHDHYVVTDGTCELDAGADIGQGVDVSNRGTTSNIGDTNLKSHIPTFYALAYIMKI